LIYYLHSEKELKLSSPSTAPKPRFVTPAFRSVILNSRALTPSLRSMERNYGIMELRFGSTEPDDITCKEGFYARLYSKRKRAVFAVDKEPYRLCPAEIDGF
jgi:hypothetical protein